MEPVRAVTRGNRADAAATVFHWQGVGRESRRSVRIVKRLQAVAESARPQSRQQSSGPDLDLAHQCLRMQVAACVMHHPVQLLTPAAAPG